MNEINFEKRYNKLLAPTKRFVDAQLILDDPGADQSLKNIAINSRNGAIKELEDLLRKWGELDYKRP